METIVKQFGLDPLLLGAQIVNFLIILFLLRRFAYKPLLALLEKRQTEAKKAASEAEQARKMLEEITEKEKQIFKAAQAEATKIIEDARRESEKMMDMTEQNAKKQQEKMMKETKAQIVQELAKAKKDLASQVSELAMHFLEKSVSGLFTEKDQKDIMARAMTKLKKKTN